MSTVAVWGNAAVVGEYSVCQNVDVLLSMAAVPGLPAWALSTTIVQPAWEIAVAMIETAGTAAGIPARATPS